MSKAPKPLPARQHFILALAISPNGAWLAANLGRRAGRNDSWGTTWLLNLASGEARLISPGLGWDGGPAVFSPDSKTLAVGTWTAWRSGIFAQNHSDYAIQLWDVSTGNKLPGYWRDVCIPFWSLTCEAKWIAFSPDGKFLSAATEWSGTLALPIVYDRHHNLLRVWDRQTGAPLKLATKYRGWLLGLAFSPDSSQLAIAINEHVSMLDIRERKEVYRYECGPMCFSPQFSPDGKFLAAADVLWRIHVWDVGSGKKLLSPQVQTSGPYPDSTRFCFVGQTLVTAGKDNTMRFWELPSWREVRSLAFPQGLPYLFSFTPDGQAIIGAGPEVNPVIHMWDAATGKELRQWDLTAVLNQGAAGKQAR